MRRKSMLPGAILTLLTLICLLIPLRVTWSVRERTLSLLSPVLKLFGATAHAATPTDELPREIQARLAQMQVLLESNQRVLDSLRGPPLAGAEPATAAATVAQPPIPRLAGDTGPLGRFLARPIWNGRALYTIDVGSSHGIACGDGVVAQGGGAGIVLALSPATCTFGPLTYPDVAVQAMVARTRAVGLLTGTGHGLELRYLQNPIATAAATTVPQSGAPAINSTGAIPAAVPPPPDNPEPACGDLVVATGRDGLFPEGTPLGWVDRVLPDGKQSGGLLKVVVQPWCDPNAADAVRVVPRRPEPIPLPDDPRQLRKQWEALQAAKAESTPATTAADNRGPQP